MAEVFGSVSVNVAFYLMLGFGTQEHGFQSTSLFWVGRGFESTTLFWGFVGLSLQLCFGGLWV